MSGRSLILLAALLVALFTRMGVGWVTAVALPFICSLLAAQLDRAGPGLARALVDRAARFLPAERREDERDAWIDHIESAREAGVEPLTRALTIALIAAPTLAVGLRVGRRRRARN
jgi:hypothetical protein